MIKKEVIIIAKKSHDSLRFNGRKGIIKESYNTSHGTKYFLISLNNSNIEIAVYPEEIKILNKKEHIAYNAKNKPI